MPPDPHHYAHLWLALVPEEIRKSITPAELNDRVLEASRLSGMASSAPGAAHRQELKERAQRVMSAAPRAATERLVADKIAKAAQLGNSPQADMLRRQAQDLLDLNPPAPRRGTAVRKTKEDPPVPVFDQDGNLVGVVDPDKLMPIASAGKKSPDAVPDAAQPAAQAAAPAPPAGQPVAKNSGLKVVVLDQVGTRYAVDRRDIRESAVRKADGGGMTYRDRGDGTAEVRDATGRLIGTISPQGGFVRQGYAGEQQSLNPTAQARNTGPVKAGGTTGLGQPRRTGPAAALPGDGPQQALPGDVEARAIIKSLGPHWRMTYDSAGRLRGAVQQCDIRPDRPGHVLKGAAAKAYASVHNSAGRRVGIALADDVIPLEHLRAAGRVVKRLVSPTGADGVAVVKSAGWTDVHDRAGQLVGIVKQSSVVTEATAADIRAMRGWEQDCAFVYDPAGRRVGFAAKSDILPVGR